MKDYSLRSRRMRWPYSLIFIAIAIAIVVAVAVFGVLRYYHAALEPVNIEQRVTVSVSIPFGASPTEIGALLKQNNLIRSEWAFARYIRAVKASEQLKAGTYSLKASQSVQEIVEVLTDGLVASDLVHIFPERRLDQVREDFIKKGFDPGAVDDAFRPEVYAGHPALVDKPSGASLEGYLYPESFHKTEATSPEEIVRASLDEMQKRLTPELRASIVRQGLTLHEGIVLASIIEREVTDVNENDRPQVAQVFLSRLAKGMRLESDATAEYGAVLAGSPNTPGFNSPYNTYLHEGLPPSPISNVTASSLKAVANPSDTDWLYFVSGDDENKTTHFSRTLAEHESNVRTYCKISCNID